MRVRAHTHCSVPEMPLLPLCLASWKIVLCSSPAAVRGTRKCESLTSWKRTSSHVDLFRNGHRFYVDLSFFVRGATHQQTYQRICYSHQFKVPSLGYLWHMYMYISTHGVKRHCEPFIRGMLRRKWQEKINYMYMYMTAYIHNEFKSSHDVSNVSCLSFSNSFLTVSSHLSMQLRTATVVDKYQ